MNVKKKKDFIKKHEYPGGTSAMKQYFIQNLKYPAIALQNKVEGKVLISYTIDFDGQVTSAKVLKGIGYQCDEEALRLVKNMKFAPQNNHGVKISTTHKIKVEFKLPQNKIIETKLTYKITPTKTKTINNHEHQTSHQNSYHYIIKIGQ